VTDARGGDLQSQLPGVRHWRVDLDHFWRRSKASILQNLQNGFLSFGESETRILEL
jgi:hypothetical protein